MALLNRNRMEERQQAEKKQEYKHWGQGAKKKGMTLYAINMDTKEVYPVKIEKKMVYDTSKKMEVATHKAHINPEHQMVLAINKKNATRKLLKAYFNE